MSELDDVVDDLYSGPPSEFVARRAAAVKAARAAKDRELATAIGDLRKPTVSAWLANLLVRDQAEIGEQIVALGEGLRDAERSLDGPALRELSSQRRQLVRSLVARARTLARATGTAVGDGAVHELETTLAAALADPEIAREVVSGRLTGPREHVGFGGTDASEPPASAPAPAKPAPAKPARAGGRLRLVGDAERAPKATERASGPSPEEQRQARREERERRARDEARAAWEQADRAVKEAQQRQDAAAAVRDESAAQVARAEEAATRAHASEDELVEELAEVRRRLTAAGKEATVADKALATSQQTLRADEKDVAAAERALRRAQDQQQAAAEALDRHT